MLGRQYLRFSQIIIMLCFWKEPRERERPSEIILFLNISFRGNILESTRWKYAFNWKFPTSFNFASHLKTIIFESTQNKFRLHNFQKTNLAAPITALQMIQWNRFHTESELRLHFENGVWQLHYEYNNMRLKIVCTKQQAFVVTIERLFKINSSPEHTLLPQKYI